MFRHQHHHRDRHDLRRLSLAVVLTLGFAAVEFVVGWWGHSLALIADAGHMVVDSTSLTLAALAAWYATRPSGRHMTWGHGRIEVIAALVNTMIMLGLIAYIVMQAINRLQTPQPVQGGAVLLVATIGLFLNLAVYRVLSGDRPSLNTRAARLHVIGDLLGSVAAMTAGIVVLTTGWTPIDPLLSLLISALLLVSALRLLRMSLNVVMEAVPAGIDPEQVRRAMCEVEGVSDVHDLHIWQISSERIALSAHVVVRDLAGWLPQLQQLNVLLDKRFGIDHPTLQAEPAEDDECVAGCEDSKIHGA